MLTAICMGYDSGVRTVVPAVTGDVVMKGGEREDRVSTKNAEQEEEEEEKKAVEGDAEGSKKMVIAVPVMDPNGADEEVTDNLYKTK